MTVTALQNDTPAAAVKTFLPKLAFGIEIEIMLSPRQESMVEGNRFRSVLLEHGWKDHIVSSPGFWTENTLQQQNRLAMRHAVIQALREETAMKVRHGWDYSDADYQYDERYKVWSVCHESLPEPPGFWSMEIVSRVLSTEDDWPAEIERAFDVLTKYCHIRTTSKCGFHVHVSPGTTIKYTDDQLQAICKGLTLFEVATTAVLPGERKNNPWAQSNVVNSDHPLVGDERPIMAVFRAIPTQSWAPVFQMLDMLSCHGHKQGLEALQGSCKSVGWNFQGLMAHGDGTGTIEIRRPPGVVSAARAKHWTGLVVGLFSEALSTNWAVEEQQLINRFDHPSVRELGDFVTRGLERLGPCNENALVKEWLKEDHSEALTEDEQEKLTFEWMEENDRQVKEWSAKGLLPEAWMTGDRSAPSDDDCRSDQDDVVSLDESTSTLSSQLQSEYEWDTVENRWGESKTDWEVRDTDWGGITVLEDIKWSVQSWETFAPAVSVGAIHVGEVSVTGRQAMYRKDFGCFL